MATFLQLCQRVGSDSGTISDGKLTTVVGQTGRLGQIVRWTNEAWRQIQNAHNTWLWMQSEFSGPTVASTQRYAYNAAGFTDSIAVAAISRFADWIYNDKGDSGFSLYDSTGVAAEQPLTFMSWDALYNTTRGTQTEGRPGYISITPQNQLALYKKPDAVYTIRGRYRKDVQDLAANDDVPECPSRFHDAIVDAALILLGTHDEAPAQIPLWQMRKSFNFCNLERDQLPRIQFSSEPLA